MSRIGKLPISIPQGVEVLVSDANVVTVKGKLGQLCQEIDGTIKVNMENNQLTQECTSEQPDYNAKHGIYRSLL